MTSATLGDYWPSKVRALEAEIARLRASKDEWIKQAAEMEAQRDKLRAAIKWAITALDDQSTAPAFIQQRLDKALAFKGGE